MNACWLVFCFPALSDAVAMVGCMLTVVLVAVVFALAVRRRARRQREAAHPNPSCPARQGADDGCIC